MVDRKSIDNHMKRFRMVLDELGFDVATARGIEYMFILGQIMFLTHHAMDVTKEGPTEEHPSFDVDLWERFYSDERCFWQALPMSPEQINKVTARIRGEDNFSAIATIPYLKPESEIQQSLFALFLRRVLGPYMVWHIASPWDDFQDALKGDDKALCRLVEIDPIVRCLPAIRKVWEARLKADRNLRDRVRDAKDRKVADKRSYGQSGEVFQDDTRKRLKLRLAAELQLWVERRLRKRPEIAPKWAKRQNLNLNAEQIRRIFDAYAKELRMCNPGLDLPDHEADLPERDDSLRKSIANWRNRIDEALSHPDRT